MVFMVGFSRLLHVQNYHFSPQVSSFGVFLDSLASAVPPKESQNSLRSGSAAPRVARVPKDEELPS